MTRSRQPESNRATIEGFLRAFRARDGAGQFARLHPDVDIEEPEGLPYGGRYRGHDGWRTLNRAILSVWDLQPSPDPHRLIGGEHDEHFALMSRLVGASRRTGRAFDMHVMEYWQVVDGLIVAIRPYYFDTRPAARIAGEEDG